MAARPADPKRLRCRCRLSRLGPAFLPTQPAPCLLREVGTLPGAWGRRGVGAWGCGTHSAAPNRAEPNGRERSLIGRKEGVYGMPCDRSADPGSGRGLGVR